MRLFTWLFGRREINDHPSGKAVTDNTQFPPQKEIVWKTSSAHLLLLSKFLRGASVKQHAHTDYWTPVLHEEPTCAIKRFIDEGMLEPLDISSRMHLKFNVSDLKEMLKKRGLKVSGNKTVLVDRLLENDLPAMESIAEENETYKCTPDGVSIAQTYLTAQTETKLKIENEIICLLKERQFKKALRTIADHELSQVFPRGLGMDWNHYGSEKDIVELSAIFDKTPTILDGINEDRLIPLRFAASMTHLFGTNKISPWLAPDFETGIHFDAETTVAMLLSHARYHRRLFELTDIGGFIKEVEFTCSDGDNTCAACKRMNGRKFKINKFPELPYPKCTSPSGCRCSVFAVFDHG